MNRPFWLTKLIVRSGIARFLPVAKRLTDSGTDYLRYYSDRVLAAPVEDLLDPANFRLAPGSEAIDLNAAAPRFEAPTAESILPTRLEPLSFRGSLEFRDAIADMYVRRDGRAVDPGSEILVTHGASGALAGALDAFINPGDRVVLFDPCSPLFSLGARSRRARIRWVPTWNEAGRCRYLPATFERAMRGAKMLILAEPGNPNGSCFAREDLEHLVWIAASYDVLIYLDESFTRYRYDDRCEPLAILPGAERRTLTARSVSQSHGLKMARVGWLAGPKHLIQACSLTANLNAPFVPPSMQQLAVRALQFREESTLAAFESRRRYLFDRLKSLGFEPEWPTGGYFMWVPVPFVELDGRRFAEQLLKEEGVLVGPGITYGPSGRNHIRISFAIEDGRLREGLGRLSSFVERLKSPPSQFRDGFSSVVESVDEVDVSESLARPVFSRV